MSIEHNLVEPEPINQIWSVLNLPLEKSFRFTLRGKNNLEGQNIALYKLSRVKNVTWAQLLLNKPKKMLKLMLTPWLRKGQICIQTCTDLLLKEKGCAHA